MLSIIIALIIGGRGSGNYGLSTMLLRFGIRVVVNNSYRPVARAQQVKKCIRAAIKFEEFEWHKNEVPVHLILKIHPQQAFLLFRLLWCICKKKFFQINHD